MRGIEELTVYHHTDTRQDQSRPETPEADRAFGSDEVDKARQAWQSGKGESTTQAPADRNERRDEIFRPK